MKDSHIIQKQWDPILNDDRFPKDPIKNKHIIGKWKCEKGHFWYETIENRAHYKTCHICVSPRKVTECYNLAYLRPDLISELHSIKNKEFTADELTPYSSKKMWWKCQKGHEWYVAVYLRTKGNNCPECSNQKVGKDNNLAVLRTDLAAEWDFDANSVLKPSDVTPGSNRKVSWICKEGHKWNCRVSHRTSGVKCLECSNRKACKDNNLAVVMPDLAAEWDYEENGNLTPYNVISGSSKIVGWVCNINPNCG